MAEKKMGNPGKASTVMGTRNPKDLTMAANVKRVLPDAVERSEKNTRRARYNDGRLKFSSWCRCGEYKTPQAHRCMKCYLRYRSGLKQEYVADHQPTLSVMNKRDHHTQGFTGAELHNAPAPPREMAKTMLKCLRCKTDIARWTNPAGLCLDRYACEKRKYPTVVEHPKWCAMEMGHGECVNGETCNKGGYQEGFLLHDCIYKWHQKGVKKS